MAYALSTWRATDSLTCSRARHRLPSTAHLPTAKRAKRAVLSATRTVCAQGFQPTPEGRAPAAAIAVVAHFERSTKTEQSKQWTKCYQAFDWTVQVIALDCT